MIELHVRSTVRWVCKILLVCAFITVGLTTIQSCAHSPRDAEVTAVETTDIKMGFKQEEFVGPIKPVEVTKPNSVQTVRHLSQVERNRERAIEWLYSKAKDGIPRHKVVEYVNLVCDNIDPKYHRLVLAIISVESGCDCRAKSKGKCACSLGLTQIVPTVWVRELKEEGIIRCANDLYDPKKNLLSCQFILKGYESKTLKAQLIKYNGHKNGYHQKVIGRMNDLNRSLI